MTTTNKPKRGQIVEFRTNHPSAKGRIVRGRVDDAGASICYPRNPTVVVPGVGSIVLRAKWWGDRVTVVDELDPTVFGGVA